MAYGPRLPLDIGTRYAHYDLIDEVAQLAKQNLKMIILTSPGERTWNPDFGVGAKRALFLHKGAAQNYLNNKIREQVAKYAPYITIRSISFDADEEYSSANITISFAVTAQSVEEILELSI
jgi:phage baseplate assembly protein W